MFSGEMHGGKNCLLSKNKLLTIYKRYRIVITELEIGAVGTDFSRQTSQLAREDPGRARTWKSMKNQHLFEMYTNTKNAQTIYRIHIFLDETGCVLNEKMVPDVTIMVPELEIANLLFCFKILLGASPEVEIS
jgi:hypothetical protein